MLKSGAQHIASLRDERAVYLHGQRVADVTVHPAYANAVKTIGRLFDFAQQQPELMSFATETGERATWGWRFARLRISISMTKLGREMVQ